MYNTRCSALGVRRKINFLKVFDYLEGAGSNSLVQRIIFSEPPAEPQINSPQLYKYCPSIVNHLVMIEPKLNYYGTQNRCIQITVPPESWYLGTRSPGRMNMNSGT